VRAIARMILVTALVCGSGCARSDWIDRTLVTVDVTGTWEGSASNAQGTSWFQLNLAQQGSQVKGTVKGTGMNRSAGQINGTVAGDVFTFRLTDVPFTGEMRVSGDEMTGPATIPYLYSRGTLNLRRVSPGSPKP
jgi:hypothetical protein